MNPVGRNNVSVMDLRIGSPESAMTPPIITTRLRKYMTGEHRLIQVSRPLHLNTTFSNCTKTSMDTMEAIPQARHSQSSRKVGNLVSHEIKWSALKDAPNRQLIGQRILNDTPWDPNAQLRLL